METDAVTAAAPDAVQEESNTLDEPSTSREDNNDDKEESASTPSTSKAADSKGAADPKNPNVRIVRGTKRMRFDVDAGHSGEKKGNAEYFLYV